MLLVRQSNLGNETVDLEGKRLPEEYLSEYKDYAVTKGDVLVGMSGSVGKLSVYKSEEPALQNQRTGLLQFKDDQFKPYIRHYFRILEGNLLSRAKGVAVQNISASEIEETPVPLPPLPEQHRIVAKIEELFTNLDAGRSDLATAEQQLERYRLSLLQAAVEGRLTADWRRTHDPEPADQLLERILEKRREQWEERYKRERYTSKGKQPPSGWRDRYKLADEPELSDNPPEIPYSWTWASVSQVGDVESGKTPKGVKEADGDDIPWYRVGDMNNEGNELYMQDSRVWVGEEQAEELGLRVLPAGTIIFPKRGGAIATNKKRILSQKSAYGLNVMGVVPRRINLRYLRYWFESIDLARFSDGSSVPQLNHGDIEPLALPLPPEEEQEVIADSIERMLSVSDSAAATAEREQTRADRLQQSILKQAFSGRLVPHEDAAAPPQVDGSVSDSADSNSSEGADEDVEDLLGSTNPNKQIEMDL